MYSKVPLLIVIEERNQFLPILRLTLKFTVLYKVGLFTCKQKGEFWCSSGKTVIPARKGAFLAAAQRRVLLYADQILRHAILAFHLRLKCTFVMVEIATLHTYARLNSLSPK